MTTTPCRHRKAEWSDTLKCRVCPCGAILPGKANKFHARRCELDGIKFDSEAERDRYLELKRQEAAGEIGGLVVHPRYRFVIDGLNVGRYTPDFVYRRAGHTVCEDVKGGEATKTEAYGLRKRLMKALHNIDVEEVTAR